MKHLRDFVKMVGPEWFNLRVAREDISPRTSTYYFDRSLYGLASLLKTEDNKLVIAHFQGNCVANPTISNLKNEGSYEVSWFDPRTGRSMPVGNIKAANKTYQIPAFPEKDQHPEYDWVLLMKHDQKANASR